MKEKVTREIFYAMKAKDNLKKSTLQLLKSNLENLEIEKKRKLTRAEELQVVQREVRQNKEVLEIAITLADVVECKKLDLKKTNERKIRILKDYLPTQLSEHEIESKLIELGLTNEMKMGQAMGIAMKELAGKADNSLISKVVKDLISK